ncbi:MAG: glycosyltransferase [Lachnospiraceae bacterium]|jgi:glycosyltransferase involved in cell wall biosynthesis|nr:glycosyltransferase [Lachnospiraceae bacterium]
MGRLLRIANIKKTIYYLKKNGLRQAWYAARERAAKEISERYEYSPLPEHVLAAERLRSAKLSYRFSVVVPVYDPDPLHLRAMIESVIDQSYDKWELILADAGSDPSVTAIIKDYQERDGRVHYRKVPENKGISGNTNYALRYTTGDYVGLLDHDDRLTPDALYEMAEAIHNSACRGVTVQMLYSDEDKCDNEGMVFFDHHRKPPINLDMILSNNYICHFLVMRRELIQTLEFRSAYDGAQDYDLVLRAIDNMLGRASRRTAAERMVSLRHLREETVHIDKVLYHWRCHADSTADNPQSKDYAYEAGKRAIEDFLRKRGWNGEVGHTRHLGFYRVSFIPDELYARPEIGIIGGRLINRNRRIAGGIYKGDGTPLFNGLHKEYSGYMHRATLRQEAEAVDVRCMMVSPAVEEYLEEVIGLPYLRNQRTGRFDWKGGLKEEADYKKISLEFCQRVRAAGFVIVWDPGMEEWLKY